MTAPTPVPRSGEFFAPLPLAALALAVVNDVWLKPALHSELTGKLSDIAICFFMPLFVSELVGIIFGASARLRLWIGAFVTATLYTAQEIVPPFTRLTLGVLRAIGPRLGINGRFQLTSDWTDLLCLVLIPVAVAYGRRRLARIPAVFKDILDFHVRKFDGARITPRFCIEGVSTFVSSGAIWRLLATLDRPRNPHEIARDTTPRHTR